ncbi:hypothetical protein B0A52_07235 [Exophiala mesophila]|uniref:Acyltransferase 3 domain-containing protein n=1 Tax=Exophiala mesophila TaxID=212818 RepID=A0A438N0K6_EXOME|nr:hypothetical protein B0A52_07235 [Exophiala mesophila]
MIRAALKSKAIHGFHLSPDVKDRAMKETGWANGLRGIAAAFVVASHLTLCYARGLVPPCCGPDEATPRLFQRPVLRLVASGHSWVALFFILMGFVNSLKPLSMARAGQVDQALAKLAQSSFSRIFRLVLPAAVATVISWLVCNLGFYQISRSSDAFWLNVNTPDMSDSWTQAFKDLLTALQATWLFGPQNTYDQPQWAMVYLLQGSVMIISALSLTINMTPAWRCVVLFLLAIWSMNWSHIIGDPWAGICCFFGIILSEVSLTTIPSSLTQVSPVLTPVLGLIALVFMSFPGSYAESAAWSRGLKVFVIEKLGLEVDDAVDRFYGSIGGILLIFAVLISPHARWALSRKPLLWLGKVSFAIYLLHGLFMRTVFAWILHVGQSLVLTYQQTPEGAYYQDPRYPVPNSLRCALATIVLIICTGAASHVWNLKLEPIFAKTTTQLEQCVKGNYPKMAATNGSILPLRKD